MTTIQHGEWIAQVPPSMTTEYTFPAFQAVEDAYTQRITQPLPKATSVADTSGAPYYTQNIGGWIGILWYTWPLVLPFAMVWALFKYPLARTIAAATLAVIGALTLLWPFFIPAIALGAVRLYRRLA